jgi:4'-phosphopantetheinyl transferase
MTTAPRQPLGPGEVHVWHLDAGALRDADVRRRFEALLSPDETARRRRYLRERTRDEFLLARGLARTVLARYAGGTPEQIRFGTTATGKPVLAQPDDAEPLHFNLSHSHGVVACAVTRDGPVGVDVELAERRLEFLALAGRYFAPAEVEYLGRLGAGELPAAFFAVWTLKEAFVKAIGQGLSFPLDSFAFELAGDRLAGFCPPASLPGRQWHVAQFRPTPRHQGAVIVETPCVMRVTVCDWSGVP